MGVGFILFSVCEKIQSRELGPVSRFSEFMSAGSQSLKLRLLVENCANRKGYKRGRGCLSMETLMRALESSHHKYVRA